MSVSTMTKESMKPDKYRWSVKLERTRPSPLDEMRKRHDAPKRFRGLRVFVMSTFLLHLFVYCVIILMLFLINLLTWSGVLWSVFPAIGWGSALAIHGGVAWFTANAGLAGRAVDRAQEPGSLPVVRTRHTVDPNEAELNSLMREALTKVDEMRGIGRGMRTPGARADALRAVNALESTLLSLDGNLEEVALAREFVGSLVDPAHSLFVQYERVAGRDVQGAKALLQQVEQQDLPRITAKAGQIHDRIHRGTMIDLQVAREMLSLTDQEQTEIE